MNRSIAPFGLRMPPKLKEEISSRAKRNNRSINAEIVTLLQEAISDASRFDQGAGRQRSDHLPPA